MGRFDYPSPYWDSVGDLALDLIDRMLTVDVEKRITIDQCLDHPWVVNADYINPADSTEGLAGDLGKLDFSKRKIQRERTLLSTINDVKISKVIHTDGGLTHNGQPSDDNIGAVHVKVWEKNPDGKKAHMSRATAKAKADGKVKPEAKIHKKEEGPAAHRAVEEFIEMGGKGDMQLFGNDSSSRYLKTEVPQEKAE